MRNYSGCTGLKTGSTSLALYNLSASATRSNLSLIAVILKAPTTKIRFAEAQKLLDYGFSNYSVTSFGQKGDIIKDISVNKGSISSVNAILESDAQVLMKKGSSDEISSEIHLEDSINAPIFQGQKLGEITYTVNGSIVANVNLVADKEATKLTFLNITKNVLSNWFTLFRNC